MTETFPTQQRTVMSIAFQAFWAGGVMTVAAFGYLVRHWRHLELLLSLPNLLALPCYWLVMMFSNLIFYVLVFLVYQMGPLVRIHLDFFRVSKLELCPMPCRACACIMFCKCFFVNFARQPKKDTNIFHLPIKAYFAYDLQWLALVSLDLLDAKRYWWEMELNEVE